MSGATQQNVKLPVNAAGEKYIQRAGRRGLKFTGLTRIISTRWRWVL